MKSSQTRDRTPVPCVGRQVFNHWTIREVPQLLFDHGIPSGILVGVHQNVLHLVPNLSLSSVMYKGWAPAEVVCFPSLAITGASRLCIFVELLKVSSDFHPPINSAPLRPILNPTSCKAFGAPLSFERLGFILWCFAPLVTSPFFPAEPGTRTGCGSCVSLYFQLLV